MLRADEDEETLARREPAKDDGEKAAAEEMAIVARVNFILTDRFIFEESNLEVQEMARRSS
jgi:hypothetical protein